MWIKRNTAPLLVGLSHKKKMESGNLQSNAWNQKNNPDLSNSKNKYGIYLIMCE